MNSSNVISIKEKVDRRPRIQIVPGKLSAVVAAAEQVLIKANAGIYQRDGKLVRIVQPLAGSGLPI